jgi:pimeloyl-ACP methyl ester carboxylesterase
MALPTGSAAVAADEMEVQIRATRDGVRYGVVGNTSHGPAPTLLVLAQTPQGTLGSQYFLQCGALLLSEGYLCVSVDLPAHGDDGRPDEPAELAAWPVRLDAGEDLLADFIKRSRAVIDHLVESRLADVQRIAAVGSSRGGFAALHLSAAEPRIRSVAAFCPVTDLLELKEFKPMKHPERAKSLAVVNLVEKLVDRNIFVVIGDRDDRVSTDAAIDFARTLSRSDYQRDGRGHVSLHVLPEPRGHTTPAGATDEAAAWIKRQMAASEKQ